MNSQHHSTIETGRVMNRIQWDRYAQRRGDICVLRYSWGDFECLKLDNQRAFAEWAGCFSLIRDSAVCLQTVEGAE